MTEAESELLRLVLSEWSRLTLMDPAQKQREGFYDWKARQAAITDLGRLGVVVDPRWLGSDAAGRQARGRALSGLVADGWLIKTVAHRRLTYVQLTDAAIQEILAATDGQAAPGDSADDRRGRTS